MHILALYVKPQLFSQLVGEGCGNQGLVTEIVVSLGICSHVCTITGNSGVTQGYIVRLGVYIILAVGCVIDSTLECVNDSCAFLCLPDNIFHSYSSGIGGPSHFCTDISSCFGNGSNNIACCRLNCILISNKCSLNCCDSSAGCSDDSICGSSICRSCIFANFASCAFCNELSALCKSLSLGKESNYVTLCNGIDILSNFAEGFQRTNGLSEDHLGSLDGVHSLKGCNNAKYKFLSFLVLCKQLSLRVGKGELINEGKDILTCCADFFISRLSEGDSLLSDCCDSIFCCPDNVSCCDFGCLGKLLNSVCNSCTYIFYSLGCDSLNIACCVFHCIDSELVAFFDRDNECINLTVSSIEEVVCGRTIISILSEFRQYFFINLTKNFNGSLCSGNKCLSFSGEFFSLANDNSNLIKSELGFVLNLVYEVFNVILQCLQLICIGIQIIKGSFQLFNHVGICVLIDCCQHSADTGGSSLDLIDECVNLTQVDVCDFNIVNEIFGFFLHLGQVIPDHIVNDLTCQEAILSGVGDDESKQLATHLLEAASKPLAVLGACALCKLNCILESEECLCYHFGGSGINLVLNNGDNYVNEFSLESAQLSLSHGDLLRIIKSRIFKNFVFEFFQFILNLIDSCADCSNFIAACNRYSKLINIALQNCGKSSDNDLNIVGHSDCSANKLVNCILASCEDDGHSLFRSLGKILANNSSEVGVNLADFCNNTVYKCGVLSIVLSIGSDNCVICIGGNVGKQSLNILVGADSLIKSHIVKRAYFGTELGNGCKVLVEFGLVTDEHCPLFGSEHLVIEYIHQSLDSADCIVDLLCEKRFGLCKVCGNCKTFDYALCILKNTYCSAEIALGGRNILCCILICILVCHGDNAGLILKVAELFSDGEYDVGNLQLLADAETGSIVGIQLHGKSLVQSAAGGQLHNNSIDNTIKVIIAEAAGSLQFCLQCLDELSGQLGNAGHNGRVTNNVAHAGIFQSLGNFLDDSDLVLRLDFVAGKKSGCNLGGNRGNHFGIAEIGEFAVFVSLTYNLNNLIEQFDQNFVGNDLVALGIRGGQIVVKSLNSFQLGIGLGIQNIVVLQCLEDTFDDVELLLNGQCRNGGAAQHKCSGLLSNLQNIVPDVINDFTDIIGRQRSIDGFLVDQINNGECRFGGNVSAHVLIGDDILQNIQIFLVCRQIESILENVINTTDNGKSVFVAQGLVVEQSFIDKLGNIQQFSFQIAGQHMTICAQDDSQSLIVINIAVFAKVAINLHGDLYLGIIGQNTGALHDIIELFQQVNLLLGGIGVVVCKEVIELQQQLISDLIHIIITGGAISNSVENCFCNFCVTVIGGMAEEGVADFAANCHGSKSQDMALFHTGACSICNISKEILGEGVVMIFCNDAIILEGIVQHTFSCI